MAGRTLVADISLEDLAFFERDAPSLKDLVFASLAVGVAPDLADAALTYRGPGWVGDRWRQVECRSMLGTYWLVVQGVGRFVIEAGGDGSAHIEAQTQKQTRVVAQTVLGPALVLALALQGTWCLHASAVVFGQHAVAFVAESGEGKSTLAEFLGTGGDPAWRRLADDLLPIAALPDGSGPVALPHFPQLKLPAHAQPAAGMSEQMPLSAIYVLDQPLPGQDTVEIRPLNWQDSAMSVVRHTMGSVLFDKELLARNLAFAGEIAVRIPVRRLAYARRYDVLPRVRDAIAADLQALWDTNRAPAIDL